MAVLVKSGSTIALPRTNAFPQLRDGPLYGTLVDMIKETIPELQKLSTADKFALAVERESLPLDA